MEEPAHQVSSDQATRSESASVPQVDVPVPVVEEMNQWCIHVQYQVYRYARVLNDKGVLIGLVTIK